MVVVGGSGWFSRVIIPSLTLLVPVTPRLNSTLEKLEAFTQAKKESRLPNRSRRYR